MPKRGYRFVGEVDGGTAEPQTVAPDQAAVARPPPPAASRPAAAQRRAWVAAAVAAAVVVAAVGASVAVFAMLNRSGRRELAAPLQIKSLAVLPFENLAPGETQEYFVDGMTDEFINAAARIPLLRVVSRTSSMYFKGARRPLSEIARMLHVDAVIEGSVARHGDRVRITAQLIETATDRHVWGETYESPLRDVLTTPATVAREVARQINGTVGNLEMARLARARVVDPEAYEAYLKGRYFWNQRQPDALRKSIEYLSEAVRRDPSSALSYEALADAYELFQIDGGTRASEACGMNAVCIVVASASSGVMLSLPDLSGKSAFLREATASR